MVDLRQQDLVLICSFYYSFMYLDLEPYSEYGSRSIRQTNTGTVRIQSGPETLCACPEKKERERGGALPELDCGLPQVLEADAVPPPVHVVLNSTDMSS